MNISDPPQGELFELIVRCLEDSASPADRRRLQDLLETDRAARQYYIERLHLMARLRWALGQAGEAADAAATSAPQATELATPLGNTPTGLGAGLWPSDSFSLGEPLPTGSPTTGFLTPLVDALARLNRLSGVPKAIALAVTGMLVGYFAVLILSLVWTRPHRADPADGALRIQQASNVTLTQAVDCRWRGQPRAVGQRLPQGELWLEAGLAQLSFDDGVQVVVEGPASFQLEHRGELFLAQGRLVAHVPPRAVGFAVETSLARIVDRGTEFGVDADASGRVQVHVFRGSVDWQTHGVTGEGQPSSNSPQRLVAGESVVLDSSASATAEKAVASPDRFTRARQIVSGLATLPPAVGDAGARLPVTADLDLWLDAGDVDGDGTTAGSPPSGSPIARWVNKAARRLDGRASDARQSQLSSQPVFRPATPRSVASVDFQGKQTEGQSLEADWPEPWARSYSVFLTGVTRGNDLSNATDYFCDGLDLKNRIALPINPRGSSQVEIGAGLGELEAIIVPLERARWQSWHLYSIVCDEGSCTFSIDGIARGRKDLPAGVLKGIKLGCRYSDAHFLNGALGEVLVYSQALSEARRQLIEDYLLSKWGLR